MYIQKSFKCYYMNIILKGLCGQGHLKTIEPFWKRRGLFIDTCLVKIFLKN